MPASARIPRDLGAARLALERIAADLNEPRTDRDRPVEHDVHRAAVAHILRLLVLLAAEARHLLPDAPMAALRGELERRAARHGEAALRAHHDTWPRLHHHRHALPGRGGILFDTDLPLDDLTLLQLLRLLPRAPGVAELGATHEALLDHTIARVEAPTLGLRGARGRTPDLPLAELERLAAAPDTMLAQLQALTARSARSLAHALRRPIPDPDLLRSACGDDEALLARVSPWAALLRRDLDDRPLVFRAGSLWIVASSERRSTGTHYTPAVLCDTIVRHTLEPLCHLGPAEGLPPDQWRPRAPAELLALRVCDLAIGCGAVLLAACRYLAARLLAAWPDPDLHALPQDPDERERHARRLVLPCLHGVDSNPLAVELARLSLWLETASPGGARDTPGPALRVGDALLGLVHADPLERPDLEHAALRRRLRAGDPAELAALTRHADALTAAALRPAPGHDPLGARQPLHWPLVFPEVLLREPPGFDAIVGNPPFQGGQRLGGALGPDYRDYLIEHLARGRRGSADLCAYFFLRAAALLRTPGQIGLLATSTIAQGDTREVGLDQLCADGLEIVRASASEAWPGAARLAVAQVWLRRGPWAGARLLEGEPVAAISPGLAPAGALPGRPHRLRATAGRSFIGSYVLGLGFVLGPDEARAWLARDPRNREVLCPYLNGEDLSRSPDQAPGRWIINFRDWPLERAESYPDCLARVRERVKPMRDRVRFSPHARERWWQYERPRVELYAAAARAPLLLACARVAKYLHFTRLGRDLVASEQVVLLPCDRPSTQAVLQSAAHEAWTLLHASTLDTRRRYTPSDCLDTFPMPPSSPALDALDALADRHDAHRRALMQCTRIGLTRTYNRLHDPRQRDPALAALRELHVELDRAVADAYGWSDLELGHAFHPTAQGPRFTVRPAARRELQERLQALNHARHAEEQAAPLRDIHGPAA